MKNTEIIKRLEEIKKELLDNGLTDKKTGRFLIVSILSRPVAMINKLIRDIEE